MAAAASAARAASQIGDQIRRIEVNSSDSVAVHTVGGEDSRYFCRSGSGQLPRSCPWWRGSASLQQADGPTDSFSRSLVPIAAFPAAMIDRRVRPVAVIRSHADIGRSSTNADAYSITSSTRNRNESEIGNASALAVFRLMISRYLAGVWTGSSPGFAPRRIR